MTEQAYNPSTPGNASVLARRNWWQTWLVILIGKYTPKCREMVRVLSQSMDKPLCFSMRIKTRLHYLICCWCQHYEEQLHYLRKTAAAFPEHAEQSSDASLSTASKERMKRGLVDSEN